MRLKDASEGATSDATKDAIETVAFYQVMDSVKNGMDNCSWRDVREPIPWVIAEVNLQEGYWVEDATEDACEKAAATSP